MLLVLLAIGVGSFVCGVAYGSLHKLEATRCDISFTNINRDAVDVDVEIVIESMKYTDKKWIRGNNLDKFIVELLAARKQRAVDDEQAS